MTPTDHALLLSNQSISIVEQISIKSLKCNTALAVGWVNTSNKITNFNAAWDEIKNISHVFWWWGDSECISIYEKNKKVYHIGEEEQDSSVSSDFDKKALSLNK